MAMIVNGRGSVGIRRGTVVSPSIVTDGLKLYLDAGNTSSYPGTGTVWTDISGNGNNGTLNGPGGSGLPSYNSANGGSIAFDGTDDYVSLPINSNTKPTTALTVGCWVRWTQFKGSNSGFPPISNSNGSLQGFIIYQATGSPYNGIKAGITTTSGLNVIETPKNLSINQWYYLTLSYDNINMYLYINGTLITNSPLTGNIVYGTSVFQLGTAASGTFSYFNGRISNVQLYNRALSTTEITQNYNALKSRYGL